MRLFSLLLLSAMILGTTPVAFAADSSVTGPVVSVVSPLSAVYTVSQVFSVSASDPDGVASCSLLVSSKYSNPMTYNAENGFWEVSYTFITYRSANSIRAVCADTYGNETNGPSKIISVSDAPIDQTDGYGDDGLPVPDEVDATAWTKAQIIATSPVLVKTVCPGGEDFTHPCRTVYFLDHSGKRHAFPNAKAYFSWYTAFKNIHLVTDVTMASFPLGRNVQYRPGVRLVKFQTINTVYAVSRFGVLRPIVSEDVARVLYGDDWNQQVDDISEAFYGNYTFGAEVNVASDYDHSAERLSAQNINDNLEDSQ